MKKIYDIHCHLFDLSHANLLAFLRRDELISKNLISKVFKKFPWYVNIAPIGLANFFKGTIVNHIKNYLQNDASNLRNLLSVMESAIEYHFLYTEYYLLNKSKFFGNRAEAVCNKIVMTPLLIDFGFKNLNNDNCFYNLPPSKPIAHQVLDVFNAIYFYYNYDVVPHPEKEKRLKIVKTQKTKNEKLFEIYPFLGINTKNYDFDEIVALFDKYFKNYEKDTPNERKQKLYDKLGTVKIDLEDLIFKRKEQNTEDYYSYIFSGIKLYPPLGFDPWPENNPDELKKVKYLYSECIKRRIPITVHCSDTGYITDDNSELYTNPGKNWAKVLSNAEFSDLKINFAHLGNQVSGKNDWLNSIKASIKSNKHVYSDCSCVTLNTGDYQKVNSLLADNDIKSNVLFGTDFTINLIWSDSYNDYLSNFFTTDFLSDEQRNLISSENSEKFLFG